MVLAEPDILSQLSQLFGYHRVASQYDCKDAYDYIRLI